MNSLAAKHSNSSGTGAFFSAAEGRIAQESVQQGGCQITCPTARRTSPTTAVGAPEAELDRLIRAAGEQMVAWYDHDRAVAHFWLRRMDALIAKRTAQHRAAIEARIQHRIEDPCYFSSDAAHSLSGGIRG